MLSLCGERLTPKVLDHDLHHDLIMLQLRPHKVNYLVLRQVFQERAIFIFIFYSSVEMPCDKLLYLVQFYLVPAESHVVNFLFGF